MSKFDLLKRTQVRMIAFLVLAVGVIALGVYVVFLNSPSAATDNIIVTMVDCAWSGRVYAWLDENENGLQDEDEPPLSNVTIYVDDVLNDYTQVSKYVLSNLQGEATPNVWLPGCPDVELEVYPQVPNGYRLTTLGRIAVDEKRTGELFTFGFAYLPGVATVTPRPSSPMVCTLHPLIGGQQYGLVKDMLITPDGVVWGITFNDGAFRFDPANHNWTIYTEKDGLPSSYIYSLSRAPNGRLWFATYNGVASFDGSSWTVHVTRDGFTSTIDDEVVLFAPNSDVWVATTEGAYKLDLNTNQQINYPIGGELHTYYIEYATLASDGTMWGVNGDFVFQLTLASTPIWIIHQIPYEYNYYRTFAIEGIAASSSGILWIAGTSAASSSVLRFDPKTSEWTVYDHLTTEGALLGEAISSFAIAPDDSIWLGTYRNGVIQLGPSASNQVSDVEIVYHLESELLENDGISAIAFAPDGAVWFGTKDSIIRCILE